MEARQGFPGPLTHLWPQLGSEWLTSVLLPPAECLPAPAASDRATWDLHSGSVDRATLAAILGRARADLGTPWPALLATQYASYFRDGDRDEYEQIVFARQRRLSRAAIAAAATLAPLWLDDVANGVVLLCEQSTWCWPAHDDTFIARGAVIPTASDPFVDLGAGEVASQLAWVDHLLGPHLEERVPGIRARLRRETKSRIFDPFRQRRDWHWLGLDGDVHNWSPWIQGNILTAALVLLEPSPERSDIVHLSIEGLDRYVAALPTDGAIDEGLSYWWQGACRALEALHVLDHASRGRLDSAAVPALRATVAFPHRMHLGGEWYLNVADGPARPPADQPWHALHRAAIAVSDHDAQAHAASHRTPDRPIANEGQGLGRLVMALTDKAWTRAEPGTSPFPRDVWLPSVQVLLARETPGTPAGLTLAAKAGHNGEHHNHNDVGSFVAAINGVPVVVDAGRPTYTAQTFGKDRYAIWTMQSAWHNTPDIRGTSQSAGRQYCSNDVEHCIESDRSALTLDIAPAYDRSDVESWRRTMELDRLRRRVTITDDWKLEPDLNAPANQIHLLLAGEVIQSDDRSITIRALENAGTLNLRSSSGSIELQVRHLDDPVLQAVWGDRLTRATITLDSSPTGHCEVTIVELDPINQEVLP